LALHTVKHFLDRFVYRNPKQKGIARGGSIMQPLPGTDTSLVLGIRGLAKTERAVNSEEWWRQQVDQIKPDEIFFHRFFVGKEESEVKALGRKRKRGAEDDDDEMDEDEIWEALVKSSKEEGGVGEVDIDDEDGSVDWSDEDEDLDEDMIGEMNDDMSDMEGVSDEDMEDVEEEEEEEDVSVEEGDVNDFFDDEAEEVEDEDESDELSEGAEKEESVDSDEGGVEGRFEFGDDESDMMGSDEEIEAPAKRTSEAKNKKRKLKSLPTFASAEDYADMLDD
jgi:ribosome biogenesis protein MAK21